VSLVLLVIRCSEFVCNDLVWQFLELSYGLMLVVSSILPLINICSSLRKVFNVLVSHVGFFLL